jgi:hypothetical protein
MVGVWLVLVGVLAWCALGICVACRAVRALCSGCSCSGARMGGVFLVKKKGVVAWLEGPRLSSVT